MSVKFVMYNVHSEASCQTIVSTLSQLSDSMTVPGTYSNLKDSYSTLDIVFTSKGCKPNQLSGIPDIQSHLGFKIIFASMLHVHNCMAAIYQPDI